MLFALPLVVFGDSESETSSNQTNSEEKRMTFVKDSLNTILQSKNLEVCKVIEDLTQIERSCITKADKKYSDFGTEHTKYLSECIEQEYENYQSKYSLYKGFISLVTAFTMECSELEREANIAKLKQKKKAKKERKKLIEKCFGKASNQLKRQIKESLHNPKSFDEVSSEYHDNNDSIFVIKYTYRGENSFGAIRTETVYIDVSIKDCEIVKVSE